MIIEFKCFIDCDKEFSASKVEKELITESGRIQQKTRDRAEFNYCRYACRILSEKEISPKIQECIHSDPVLGPIYPVVIIAIKCRKMLFQKAKYI